MKSEKYHKYVFDPKTGEFLGKFEEMYRGEDTEDFDSWYQDDLNKLRYKVSSAIIDNMQPANILDLGCGKGKFTSIIKRPYNEVTGVDISETAIAKARERYPHIAFGTMDIMDVKSLDTSFNLVVAMEVLSYIKDWYRLLSDISEITDYLYITLYLPKKPNGYVSSFDELLSELRVRYSIEIQMFNKKENSMYILAKSNRRPKK